MYVPTASYSPNFKRGKVPRVDSTNTIDVFLVSKTVETSEFQAMRTDDKWIDILVNTTVCRPLGMLYS